MTQLRKGTERGRGKAIWRLFGPDFRRHRLRLGLTGLGSFAVGLGEALTLVLIARIAFALTDRGRNVAVDLGPFGTTKLSVPAMLVIAASAVAVKFMLQAGLVWNSATLNSRLIAERRRSLTHLFLGASWALQSSERQGHLQELTTTYVTQAVNAFTAVVNMGTAALSLLALLGSAFVLNPIASLGAFTASLALALLLRPLRAATRRRSRRAAQANLEYATKITEVTSQAQEIRVFNVVDAVGSDIDHAVARTARMQFRTMLVSRAVPAIYRNAALLFIIGTLAVVYASGTTRLAALGAIVLILLRTLSAGQGVQTSYQSLQEGYPYAEALEREEGRYRMAAAHHGGAPVHQIDEVAFDHVWFEYEEDVPVLRDINFSAHRGQVIGIIGPSGSGKSTLVQLLLRLRDPTSGSIRADDRDVQTLALDQWYQQVAFVPQEARLFAGSIADNIRFFREAEIDRVQRAGKLAHIHDEILALPHGYDTEVGQRGGQVSGGQRQRICIARSLIADPDILVLDEPTSALDVLSESLIRESVAELGKEMLVVVIAHRLSTLSLCDRIMVLQEGEIRGFDHPQTLEQSSTFYRDALRLAGLR